METWNIIVVEKYGFPRKIDAELQVRSATILGAVMKANRIIKNEYPGHKIRSVWRLNPKLMKENGNDT